MCNLAIRRGNTTIASILGVVALVTLLVLASEPDRPKDESNNPSWRTTERASSQVTRPTVRRPVNTVPQRDASLNPGIAAASEDIRLSQQHSNLHDRFEAISALGDSRNAMAELTLVSLLHDQDPAIRESAVESLASLGTHGALQGLSYALTDANPLVRRAAVELLVDIGTPDAVEALSATLVDPDVDMRLAAVYELADNESEAGSALLQEFLSDADPAVRILAAEFLTD